MRTLLPGSNQLNQELFASSEMRYTVNMPLSLAVDSELTLDAFESGNGNSGYIAVARFFLPAASVGCPDNRRQRKPKGASCFSFVLHTIFKTPSGI